MAKVPSLAATSSAPAVEIVGGQRIDKAKLAFARRRAAFRPGDEADPLVAESDKIVGRIRCGLAVVGAEHGDRASKPAGCQPDRLDAQFEAQIGEPGMADSGGIRIAPCGRWTSR